MAFFEKIGKHLTDAGQSVAQQTKNIADVTQLNISISDKEKKISQLLMMLGQSYYETHKNDEFAEQPEKITEIRVLYEEIIQHREKIKQIKGITKCEKCGADVPINVSFCDSCGTKIVQHKSEVEMNGGGTRVCPSCHAIVAHNNLFCNHCGAKMENN